jgi:hypothetical protein
MPVPGVHVEPERTGQERAAPGGQHHRACLHRPGSAVVLAGDAGGAGHRAVRRDEQFQGRVMVEDPHAGSADLPPHPAHVLRAL